jgi:hypothetical protein
MNNKIVLEVSTQSSFVCMGLRLGSGFYAPQPTAECDMNSIEESYEREENDDGTT